MPETIVLDPPEVAGSRAPLDITHWVESKGITWGDAEIQAYMAEQGVGQAPVDFRLPNRKVEIPLVLKDVAGTFTFNQIRTKVQAKAALFQREGGFLKRLTSAGGTLYADVVSATLKLGGGWGQAHEDYDVDASLELECLPDFYEDEVVLDEISVTTAGEAATVLKTNGSTATIRGNYPGRLRIEVEEESGVDQLGVLAALRSRHFSSATTAATVYEAESLDPVGNAAGSALTGASGGTVVSRGSLTTEWITVMTTAIGGSTHLTHEGTYRPWARVHSHGGALSLRLLWDIGDLTLATENAEVDVPAVSDFCLVDLGEVRLDPPPVGTHRWQGLIQAKGSGGTETVSIDKLYFFNVDEGYAALRAVEI